MRFPIGVSITKLSGGKGAVSPLDRLTALLGPDVFFVPCEWGTKKPLVTYVERPFEETKSRHMPPCARGLIRARENQDKGRLRLLPGSIRMKLLKHRRHILITTTTGDRVIEKLEGRSGGGEFD